MGWRVRDWDQHFETHKTRILQRVSFVPIPNKLDGDGFTWLLNHPDGVAHYGAWMMIVLIASKCDPRGWLVRDELRSGEFRRTPPEGGATVQHVVKIAHSCGDLARISRANISVFECAIPRLMTIGWLEEIPPKSLAALTVAKIRKRGPKNAGYRRMYAGARGSGNEVKRSIDTPPAPALANGAPPPAIKFAQTAELAIASTKNWDRDRWRSVLEFCRSIADQLPDRCRPLARCDTNEIFKIGILKFADALPDSWIDDAINKANCRSTKKPLAAFHATMAGKCADAGFDFNRALKSVTIPDWFKQ
jgi:hypothetical protein